MSKEYHLKIDGVEPGYCRIYYLLNGRISYCFQDEGPGYGGVILYSCERQGEPDHPVQIKEGAVLIFELPKGNTEIEVTVREEIIKRGWYRENTN